MIYFLHGMPCPGNVVPFYFVMYKYEIILYWSNDDRAYVAEVPELPGCMAHGETQEEALEQVNAAIGLWIDTAQEFGKPVPEPKGQRLMLA